MKKIHRLKEHVSISSPLCYQGHFLSQQHQQHFRHTVIYSQHSSLSSSTSLTVDDLATSSLIRWRLLNHQHAAHYPYFSLLMETDIFKFSFWTVLLPVLQTPHHMFLLNKKNKKQTCLSPNFHVQNIPKGCSINYAFFFLQKNLFNNNLASKADTS